MTARDGVVEDLATAQEVARFFDCEVGTQEEFRGVYQRLRAARDGEVVQDAPAPKPTASVVLSCGESRVTMPEEDYVAALAEHGLAPPGDGLHSTLAVLWLAQSAQKRGLADLAKKLMDLRSVGRGLIFVRRPDGAIYTPKPVTAVKVARAGEGDQQAVAADVEAYFAAGEPAPR